MEKEYSSPLEPNPIHPKGNFDSVRNIYKKRKNPLLRKMIYTSIIATLPYLIPLNISEYSSIDKLIKEGNDKKTIEEIIHSDKIRVKIINKLSFLGRESAYIKNKEKLEENEQRKEELDKKELPDY